MNGFRAYLPVLVITAVALTAAAPAYAQQEVAPPPETSGVPLPADPSPADGLRDLLAATNPGKARTGLGIPGYDDLLGRGWKGKVAEADAALIGQLNAAATTAPRASRVNTPDYDTVDPLSAGDSIRGKGGKQTRRFRMQAAVDPCPVLRDVPLDQFEDGVFEVRGDFRAEYEVTTVERVGKYDVKTYVLFDIQGRSRAQSTRRATLFSPSAGVVDVNVTRSQTATNRKTGKTKRTGPPQTHHDTLSPLFRLEGGFEEFIEQQNGSEAPAPKRILRSGVWTDATQLFVEMTYLELEAAYKVTEKRSTTPNVCAELSLEAPDYLAPGQTTQITGHVFQTQGSATHKQILMQGFGAKGWYANEQGQTAAFRPDYNPGWSEGRPWIDFTAPAKAWPASNPVGYRLEMTTMAGAMEATIYFKPVESTLYFKVTSANASYRTTATGESNICGTQSGRISFDGSFADRPFSVNNKVEQRSTGTLTGQIEGRVNALWHDHVLEGCKLDNLGQKVPCTSHEPDQTPRPDGTWPIGFSVRNGSNSGEAQLRWHLDQPHVGYIDSGADECWVYMEGAFPAETGYRTVSLDTLRGTDPITLNFDGSDHLDVPGWGGGSFDHTWSYSLTIQRVDSTGQPLG